ncbi:ATP-binding protein [Dyella sp. BiH032]|uniref:Dph6-related ATP pyrophosphatase n=1 Tax=Dyella sp. BiH032 TaxID=3075430 RepID=UPI002892FC84|nr:ATP-binding protein [Dyella sp. BiH032]WNL47375.1 ATP-binding protein [Dyella sp. BiH032]
MQPVPILLAWSGGKDCLMALQHLLREPRWQPVGLLATVNRTYQRVAMHGTRRDVLHAQAEALGLPLLEAELDWPGANEAYEAAQARALAEARRLWPGVRHCAFGDLFLADVRDYRVRQLGREGWRAVFPLWGEDTTALARRFVGEGHRAALCCVDTQQLDPSFCGQAFDNALLDTLPAGVDPCGERGEFHTLCFGGPLFRRPLALRRGESTLRDGRFQYTDFLLADGPH